MSRYYDYFKEQSHTAGEVTTDDSSQKPCAQILNSALWQKNYNINGLHG